jgi:hypothetical protein
MPEADLLSLTVHGKTRYAGVYKSGLWKSEDEGKSWTATTLSHIWVTAVVCKGDTIFAGMDGGGVKMSTDGGANWNPLPGDLPYQVLALELDGDRLYAGTKGSSVWTVDLNASGAIVGPVNRLSGSLFTFVGSDPGGVWIRILSPGDDQADIRLIDPKGEIRLRVRAEGFSKVSGRLRLPAGNLPPGKYLLQVRCGSRVEVQAVSLTR